MQGAASVRSRHGKHAEAAQALKELLDGVWGKRIVCVHVHASWCLCPSHHLLSSMFPSEPTRSDSPIHPSLIGDMQEATGAELEGGERMKALAALVIATCVVALSPP